LFSKNYIIALRISMFYAAYFAMVGVALPFFPVWLSSSGLTPENIGVIIGCSTFVRVFFDPFIAQLADKRGSRQPFIILLVAFALVFFSLYFISNTFWIILLVTILYSSCCGATQPLAESLTMLAAKSAQFEYGRVRLWGSLTFILAAIIAGNILVDNSSDIILLMILGTMCFLLIVTIFLPNIKSSIAVSVRFPIIPLLRDKRFTLVLIAAALIQSSHAVYYGFGTIHWQKSGISEVIIGLLWAEGVIAEVVVFIFGGIILRNLGPIRLIFLGGLAGVFRWIGTGLDDNLIILFILQILHGFTFGATHLGIIYYISNNVSESFSATAMGLYAAVGGLAMGLMVIASGQIYALLGGQAYFVVAIISAFGCMLCLYSTTYRT
jgi:PPP family 3-phenylpropionic acid transporter